MKKYILIASCLFLGACCTPKVVEKKVYEPPTFDMPARPVLSSKGGSFNAVGKNVEKDLIDLKAYALKLENTLNELKTPKTINNNNEIAK